MGFFDRILERFDRFMVSTGGPLAAYFKKYFMYVSVTVMTAIVGLYIVSSFYERPYYIAQIMQNDLDTLLTILNKIDNECDILHIKNNHVVLDFFTVKNFAGSEIGGINLAYPQNWSGPYMTQNPVLQQCYYELIVAQDGAFVVPGNGATLPNGKIMGKDIVLNTGSTVGQYLDKQGALYWEGSLLARKIPFKIGDWHARRPKKDEKVKIIDNLIEEFNQALPYS